jgi:hypothetical protein
MEWDTVVHFVTPHIFHIYTPNGNGTGFLFLYNEDKTLCGVATALHVVSHSDEWQEPIRIVHHASKQSVFLQEADRIIMPHRESDSAAILFEKPEFPLPENLIQLLPLESPLDIGAEVCWGGFPWIEEDTLCFFSGNISARQSTGYLIDGVAIHGVSGGPVVHYSIANNIRIVGVVSAYKPNRLTDETLPGLLYAQDVSYFQGVLREKSSIYEARKKKEELERSSKSSTQ